MSTVMMDMSSFAFERASSETEQYGEEVLNAGWNPALSQQQRIVGDYFEMPHSLVSEDVDVFLKRMYANQR